ncbi:MAG TPA: hypothetical protein VM243_02880, partial [Phycisphaerae bacterium]|nr:hypothetical protein [Phycisphaerae bacterium]
GGGGGVAGRGMFLGARGQQGTKTGLIAAGMSLCGVLAAKLLIFCFVLYAVFTGETDDPELQRGYVMVQLTDELLDEREVYDEAERERQWDEVFSEAKKRAEQMSDAEVRGQWEHYRQEEELNAWQEGDPQRHRLAYNEARRTAEREGLAYDDQRRQTYRENAFEKYREMSGEELEAAIAELDAWEAEGRWADAEYVRDFLVYQHVDRALEDQRPAEGGEDEYPAPSKREWKKLHDAAVADVDAMTVEDRLARARQIEHEQELDGRRNRLASHRAERRVQHEGLPDWSEDWEKFYEEESTRAGELSEEEVEAAVADLDVWEADGKWSDAAYVRDYLIYDRIEQAADELPIDDEEEIEPQEWRALYEAAAAEVEGIPEAQRARRARQVEADEEREFEEMKAQWEEGPAPADEEMEGAVGAFLLGFAFTMFGLMDLLFMGLAVVSAFRIGSRGFSKGE